MGSGHILGHLLWQSGLPQRSGLLLIRCLCKCSPWAWSWLFHPHAALGQMHLCFPLLSFLPGHGSPCSSADRTHRKQGVCKSGQLLGKQVSTNAVTVSPLHCGLGVSPWAHASGGAVRASHRPLVSHIALKPSKGVCLPFVRPQDLCVQYMAPYTHTEGISPTM